MSSHDGLKRLAMVVPEFRAEGKRSGGLDAVAQFVLDSFTAQHGWTVRVASPRMSRRAAESRRVLDPRSWHAPRQRDAVVEELPISYFGADLAELEYFRYQPRRGLTAFLDECDVVLIVAGSPAIVNVARDTRRPVVAQIATFIEQERQALIRQQSGMRRVARLAMTRIVAGLDERALHIPQVVLVENPHMKDECEKRRVPVQLIAPGVDCKRFRPGAPGPRPGFILAVGRWLDPRKDVRTLLRAFALARELGGIQQTLLLAGLQGPCANDLRLIDALGLEDSVQIRENVPLNELAHLYRSADLFATTSTEEGLGIVFLEAMASGTPIVTTATMGASYALGNACAGQLVDFGPDLVERFASVLTEWCQDAARRHRASAAARVNVEQRFDASHAGARFRAIVDRLLPP